MYKIDNNMLLNTVYLFDATTLKVKSSKYAQPRQQAKLYTIKYTVMRDNLVNKIESLGIGKSVIFLSIRFACFRHIYSSKFCSSV